MSVKVLLKIEVQGCVCVCVCVKNLKCKHALSSFPHNSLAIAPPAGVQYRLSTFASSLQSEMNPALVPAALAQVTPSGSSSQALVSCFIWYHNISATPIPSRPPPLLRSLPVWPACFHSEALTKTGEIITAGPKPSKCLSRVISTKPHQQGPCHRKRRKRSIVLKMRSQWHHFKELCSECSTRTINRLFSQL